MLAKIILSYWQVCRLSLSPGNTPNSGLLTGIILIIFLLVKLGALLIYPQLTPQELQYMILQLIIVTITLLGYTYLVLKFNQRLERFIRTINCLLACSIMIEILTVPILLLMTRMAVDDPKNVPVTVVVAQITAFFILFVLAIWNIIINVFIYQQSLDIQQSRAFLVWLGLIGIQMSLLYIGGLYG